MEDKLVKNKNFADLTTLGIGGPIEFFLEVTEEQDLVDAITFAREHHLPYLVIGGGSNLLVSDQGFEGLIIHNNIQNITQTDDLLTVASGTPLQDLVDYTIANNLGGLNKLTGIPGTVGGAVYGNAGAYGQTISDLIQQVRCFDGEKIVTLEKEQCQFGYRDSGFKTNHLVILEVVFEPPIVPQTQDLQQESQDILQKRLAKWPPGVKSPGSFFKNLLVENVPQAVLDTIPNLKDYYGKVPAWYFLEEVGAKDDQQGQIKIADYHANLFINLGGGKAQDFYALAKKYYQKVKEKFNIELEPEVQLINLPKLSSGT